MPGEPKARASDPPAPVARERIRSTLRDVAAAAGVSIATASHAFNRPGRIAPTTRERVLAAARALDYPGPDPAARALRIGRAETMTLIAPGPVAELLARTAPTLMLQGVAAVCDREGLGIRIASRFEGARGPMIVLRPAPGSEAPAVAAIVVDGMSQGAMAVNADIDAAATEIRDHLAALGHRHLGIIGWRGEERRAIALAAAWRKVGPVVTAHADGLAWGHGEVAAVALISRTPRPTALVAVADELALGALDGALRLRLEVPKDLSVVGIDDIPESAMRGLTTAFVPYEPMGELAGTLAVQQLDRRDLTVPPPLPAPLAIRATTGRPA